MRPPFLKRGGENNFSDYQKEFDALLPSGLTDVLGNNVIFRQDRCHHICYKSEDVRWNKGPRDQWRQDRAERIPWIKAALQTPKFIRISTGTTWAYLLDIAGDRENDLSPELFAVFVEASEVTPDTPGEVYFLTGYVINIREWEDFKKNKPWVYPKEEPKSLKPKKKK